MRSVLRALVPAAIVGAWSGVLWHEYLVELGEAIGAWRRAGAFDVITTAAVALGAALLTLAIVHEPAPRLATARVPRRHPLALRAPTVLAIVSLLAMLDRLVERPPPAPPPHEDATLEREAPTPRFTPLRYVSADDRGWCGVQP